MINTSTYQIKPYLLIGSRTEDFIKPGTEWIRDVVKGLMHQNSKYLHQKNVDTSLFHNHDEKTSQTLIRYPRIIYHYTNEKFFVTGINEGVIALQHLFDLFKYPVSYNDKIMVSFSIYKSEQIRIVLTEDTFQYKINNWLAMDSKTHKQYLALSACQKMQKLDETLHKHITNDLFKYLSITLEDIQVEIQDIVKFDQKLLSYKDHRYLPFNLIFTTNFLLPDFLALGNGKVFGYGIIEQLNKTSGKQLQ